MGMPREKIDVMDAKNGRNAAIIQCGNIKIDLKKVQITIDERHQHNLSWSQLTRAFSMGLTVGGECESWSKIAKEFYPALELERGEALTKEQKNSIQQGYPIEGLAEIVIEHFKFGNGYQGLQKALRDAESYSLQRGSNCNRVDNEAKSAVELDAPLKDVAAIARDHDIAAINTQKQAAEVWGAAIRGELIPEARRLRPELYGTLSDDAKVWEALLDNANSEAGKHNYHDLNVNRNGLLPYEPSKRLSEFLCQHLGIEDTALAQFLNLAERSAIYGIEKTKDGKRDIDFIDAAMDDDKASVPIDNYIDNPRPKSDFLTFVMAEGKTREDSIHHQAHKAGGDVGFVPGADGVSVYDRIRQIRDAARAGKGWQERTEGEAAKSELPGF